jgi:hypothetical protein
MFLHAIATVLVASIPTPSGTKDITIGLYYSGQSHQAVALCGSAATSLTVATYRLTDGTLCGALAHAASNGIAVQVAYNGTAGTNDAQWIATRGIVAASGTVYACSFPNHIANNLVVADAGYSLIGSYYYSPTAVQIGAYSIGVSGTNTAFQSHETFTTLISGGTITAFLAPLIEDLGNSPIKTAACRSNTADRENAAMICRPADVDRAPPLRGEGGGVHSAWAASRWMPHLSGALASCRRTVFLRHPAAGAGRPRSSQAAPARTSPWRLLRAAAPAAATRPAAGQARRTRLRRPSASAALGLCGRHPCRGHRISGGRPWPPRLRPHSRRRTAARGSGSELVASAG